MSTEEDATPGPAVQRLAPEDIHLIAGAVADIIRSPSTASLPHLALNFAGDCFIWR